MAAVSVSAQTDSSAGWLKIQRDITPISENTWLVELRFDAPMQDGRLRIIESAPAGCHCNVREGGSAKTTAAQNQAVFEWFNFKPIPQVQVQYEVQCIGSIEGDNPEIKSSVYYKGNFVPAGTPYKPPRKPATGQEPWLKDHKYSGGTNETEKISAENAAMSAGASGSSNIRVSKTDNVYFSVQIVSGKSSLEHKDIFRQYGFDEPMTIEMREDRNIYMSGNYATYSAARKECDRIKVQYPTLPGPFVVAYRNGVRIDVPTAMAITSAN